MNHCLGQKPRTLFFSRSWLLAPHFETLRTYRRFAAPLTSFAVGLVLMGAGFLTQKTTAEHPIGASWTYAVDSDSGKAWLTGFGAEASARTWVRHSLTALPNAKLDRAPTWATTTFDARALVAAPGHRRSQRPRRR